MKNFGGNYANAVSGTITTYCHCWHIVRRDGAEFGFTDWDQDLEFAGITFKAADGFAPSDVDHAMQGTPQVTISSFLGEQVTANDLGGGLYDGAEVMFMRVNVYSLPGSLDPSSGGFDLLVKGKVGIINHGDQKYSLEFRGLGDRLKHRIGWKTQKDCRYEFGDHRCGFDRETTRQTLTVTGSNGRMFFTVGGSFDDNRYTGCELQWLSGDNEGYYGRVVSSMDGQLGLANPAPQNINSGDTFTITKNCLKTESDCSDEFNNLRNFGGEGVIPGQSGFAQWGTSN